MQSLILKSVSSHINIKYNRLHSKETDQRQRGVLYNNIGINAPGWYNNPNCE